MFIVFEGIDGTGKTTQAVMLKNYLEKKGRPTVVTHAPGGTPECEKLRKFLLDPKNEIGQKTQMLLFQAINAEICEKIIEKEQIEGKIVISDRFTDSAIAYQGELSGYSKKEIEMLCLLACGNTKPDLVILLDADPEKLLERRKNRGTTDRFEEKDISFQKKIRNTYLETAKTSEILHVIVNAEDDVKTVAEEIKKICDKFIEKYETEIKILKQEDEPELRKLFEEADKKEFKFFVKPARLLRASYPLGYFVKGKLSSVLFANIYDGPKEIWLFKGYTVPEQRKNGNIKKLMKYIAEKAGEKTSEYKWILRFQRFDNTVTDTDRFAKKYSKDLPSIKTSNETEYITYPLDPDKFKN